MSKEKVIRVLLLKMQLDLNSNPCLQSIVTVGKWINKFEEGYSKLKV